ncbi:hypothetical protein SprV_0200648300 [Sparganum proliferum]
MTDRPVLVSVQKDIEDHDSVIRLSFCDKLQRGAFAQSTVQLAKDVENSVIWERHVERFLIDGVTVPSPATDLHPLSGSPDSSESAALSTSSTQTSETTGPTTTSEKSIAPADLEGTSGADASSSSTSDAWTTESSASVSEVEQGTTVSESHSSAASDVSSTVPLTAVHTEDHNSEQPSSETASISISNQPEETVSRPTNLLIQKASGEGPTTTPAAQQESNPETSVSDADTAPTSTPPPSIPSSTETHSPATESPASDGPESSLPAAVTEAKTPPAATTTTTEAGSEPVSKSSALELESTSTATSGTEEHIASSTASSGWATTGSSMGTGEMVTASSPTTAQEIHSTQSPESTEHTFTFVLPDFYDHEQLNMSDEEHHFNDSDWASFGAGVETEGSNEMFDDACAYLQHRVEYLFKVNVSKHEIQKLISELKIHEVREEDIPALHKNLTECVTSWEESSDDEPSAVCALLKTTIADVCKRIDGCNEEDLMKTAFEHLKHLLTTDSLHDAIVMMHACVENAHGGHHNEA